MQPPDADAGQWTRRFGGRVYADRQTVFRLLAEIELWPALFRHIQSARVLRRDGRRRLVDVRAAWHGLPIGWRTIEIVDEAEGRMTLRYLSRLTRGSVAVYTVGPTIQLPDGRAAVDVTVVQHVRVSVPLIGGILARSFGQAILDRVKQVAEGASLAGRG